MRHMKNLFFVFLVIFSWQAVAQENLMPLTPYEKDSSQIELERLILYRQLLTGTLQSGGLDTELGFQKFDTNLLIEQQQYNFNAQRYLNTGDFGTFPFSPHLFFSPSPFFRNGMIFGGSTYGISDKFKLGGYSFGANSVFSAPLPNQNPNTFDTRGATMFMQYKVSKNFKIETRVSVSQGNAPGF